MKVIWTPEAQADRENIWHYIFKENRSAAVKIDKLFGRAAKRLATNPKLGRRGIMPGTREIIPHKNYRLIYEIDDGIVWVLALIHTSREWP